MPEPACGRRGSALSASGDWDEEKAYPRPGLVPPSTGSHAAKAQMYSPEASHSLPQLGGTVPLLNREMGDQESSHSSPWAFHFADKLSPGRVNFASVTQPASGTARRGRKRAQRGRPCTRSHSTSVAEPGCKDSRPRLSLWLPAWESCPTLSPTFRLVLVEGRLQGEAADPFRRRHWGLGAAF